MKKKIIITLFLTLLFSAMYSQNEVITGAERMEEYLEGLKNKKVALLTNQTGVVRNSEGKLVHLLDTLLSHKIDIVKVFSPEHGFRGNVEAGGVVKNSVDSKTGLPIVSLYGKNKKPTKEQMQDFQILLFDLQDVGCRFYTYISTLHYVMEACAENNCRLILLDRPNPNDYIDGPVLEPEFKSFVGMHTVPVLHAMTIGEYAQMINGEGWLKDSIKCDLQVIKLLNWHHNMEKVYQLLVAPSPNLQTPKAIALYPSLCFFEGTKISVGRGTQTPFEIIGSPEYPDTTFSFTPIAIKGVSDNPPYKNTKCYGMKDLQEKNKELDLFFLKKMYKSIEKKENFFTLFFDKLAGTDKLRKQIENGMSEEEIKKTWQKDIEKFKKIRLKYLLYK
jgi:uncharacterized protein YbbC (DUF1343 family)